MPKTGVVFSSGYFGFFAHGGFLAALREQGIVPDGYAGASSGAIIAAMAASGLNDNEIKGILFQLTRKDFWDPDTTWALLKGILKLFRGYTGYLKGEKFTELLNKLPVEKIEDCKLPLSISATNLTDKTETNFIKGDIRKAVCASGAVPMLFKPVEIGNKLYVDGGLVNKAPVQSMMETIGPERIYVHYIESGNIKAKGNGFLNKRMTPWHIYHLSMNIARHEAYCRQVEACRRLGIEIIKIKTNTESLGPSKLGSGPTAYEKAKEETGRILKNRSLKS